MKVFFLFPTCSKVFYWCVRWRSHIILDHGKITPLLGCLTRFHFDHCTLTAKLPAQLMNSLTVISCSGASPPSASVKTNLCPSKVSNGRLGTGYENVHHVRYLPPNWQLRISSFMGEARSFGNKEYWPGHWKGVSIKFILDKVR